MFKEIRNQIRPALFSLITLTLFIGIIYVGIVTICAQVFFAKKADGSLIVLNGKPVGSRLIGQDFTEVKYFWGRPSATKPFPSNALAASGSNLATTNPTLVANIKNHLALLHQVDPDNKLLVPADLIATSASGLDPEISPAAAYYQVHRVAQARNLSDDVVHHLVTKYTKTRQFGFLGEPRVNVLELNLALDHLSNNKPS